MYQNDYYIIVIGGGIVGLATAYKLLLRYPNEKILVLEKEVKVAMHQTGHNSGVIHSGIYYKPGSYKARTCVKGRKEMVAFAKEHGIAHDICGKLIVATEESELEHLNRVYQRGLENEVEGIELINREQIREVEPFCEGIAGINVPCTGIIDYSDVAYELVALIRAKGGTVLTGEEVVDFKHYPECTTVITKTAKYTGNYLIACAGLQSDRVATKEGANPSASILGFRGDYYELSEQSVDKVKHLIYPVPNPKFPFLGVHFTRMIKGGVECGPNAVFVFKREGYKKLAFSLFDTYAAFSFSGTWRFFAKHWRYGIEEYRRAYSKRLFLNSLQKLIPSLTMEDIQPARAGVRAMALEPVGEMIDDFKLAHHNNAIHILNAPSPAATASLAIGDAVADMAKERFSW